MKKRLDEISGKLYLKEIENALFLTILTEFTLFLMYSFLNSDFLSESIIKKIQIVLTFLGINFLLYIRFKRKGGKILSIILFIWLIIIGHFLYFSVYLPPLYIEDVMRLNTSVMYKVGKILFLPLLIGILFYNFLPPFSREKVN